MEGNKTFLIPFLLYCTDSSKSWVGRSEGRSVGQSISQLVGWTDGRKAGAIGNLREIEVIWEKESCRSMSHISWMIEVFILCANSTAS